MQVVAQGMIEKGQGGSIVNVSSTAGAIPFPRGSVYSMSKVALDMLTKCMTMELGKHKVCYKKLHVLGKDCLIPYHHLYIFISDSELFI